MTAPCYTRRLEDGREWCFTHRVEVQLPGECPSAGHDAAMTLDDLVTELGELDARFEWDPDTFEATGMLRCRDPDDADAFLCPMTAAWRGRWQMYQPEELAWFVGCQMGLSPKDANAAIDAADPPWGERITDIELERLRGSLRGRMAMAVGVLEPVPYVKRPSPNG